MDTPKLLAGHFRAEESSTFNVLALYEDFDSGKLAKEVYTRIRSQLPDELTTDLELFRFDTFRTPRIKRLLQAKLSLPDALIVASSGDEPLPEEAKLWIRQWASDKGKGSAIIGLLRAVPDSRKERSPVFSWLKTLTDGVGAQFFAHAFAAESKTKKPGRSNLVENEDYSHAGINE